jgi:hypothetical protein
MKAIGAFPSYVGRCKSRGMTAGSQKRRGISQPAQRALYGLSNGTCYFPGCPQPVVVVVDGKPRPNVEIAHIYGVGGNAQRHQAQMEDPERDSFGHLILLCKPHHAAVDDPKTGERDYPEHLLHTWKLEKEKQHPNLLNALPEADVFEAIGVFFEEPTKRLEALGDRLDSVVKELTKTGQAGTETVAELRAVVNMLRNAPDYGLAESAGMFQDLQLAQAADELTTAAGLFSDLRLHDAADSLSAAAEQLRYAKGDS